jgi:hypothetical protein
LEGRALSERPQVLQNPGRQKWDLIRDRNHPPQGRPQLQIE